MAKEEGRRRRFKLPEMEGGMARWYARQRGSGTMPEEYRRQAAALTTGLRDGADVLEVAPGPGYLSVEIARIGRFHVSALDISRTFVEIASENARQVGVRLDVRHGDASAMPFEASSFDLIVCQAAFKNFTRPVTALNEMHRVPRPGGVAVIDDMSHEATGADIAAEVRRMDLSPVNAVMTRVTLTGLRRRAYSPSRFEQLAAQSAFGTCTVHSEGIGLQVHLPK